MNYVRKNRNRNFSNFPFYVAYFMNRVGSLLRFTSRDTLKCEYYFMAPARQLFERRLIKWPSLMLKVFQGLAQDFELLRRPASASGESERALEVVDGAHRQRKEGEERQGRFGKLDPFTSVKIFLLIFI